MAGLSFERQLWKYEYGRLDRELLYIELKTGLESIGDRAGAMPYAADVSLWNPKLPVAFDDATALARTALDENRFRDAVRQMRRAEMLFRSIGDLLDAHAAVEAADAAVNDIHALVTNDRLRRLPVVASLGQMVDTARRWIGEERYREASHLAHLCGRVAAALFEAATAGAADRESFAETVASLEDVVAATATFVDEDDVPASVELLSSLFSRRYVRLAMRLATELQMELGGRYRFRLQWERARREETNAFGSIDEVRTLIDALSWDGAVDYGWQVAIQRFAGALQQQMQRLQAITEESWAI